MRRAAHDDAPLPGSRPAAVFQEVSLQLPVYPARKCREPVWSGDIAHSCDLPEGHAGPPASLSWPESIRIRDAWEEANPEEAAASAAPDPYA
jgi:hypothetical protein